VTLAKALRNALLELAQIDAAMGHWYGGGEAPRLDPGPRTALVERLIRRRVGRQGSLPRFHWLRSAGLPGFAIAAIVEGDEPPYVAVGLGCDLELPRAIYKAFLEGVAVAQLAKVVLFRRALERRTGEAEELDPARIYDLDGNVAHYAESDPDTVRARFDQPAVSPEELPEDVRLDAEGQVRHLLEGFRAAGARLAGMDLTTPDVRALGFRIVRVWSPELLTLSLPSAPPALHPRFRAYGGFAREIAHPYP
jgi:thiazole/oxazole-forming peptide maturase SagD family component